MANSTRTLLVKDLTPHRLTFSGETNVGMPIARLFVWRRCTFEPFSKRTQTLSNMVGVRRTFVQEGGRRPDIRAQHSVSDEVVGRTLLHANVLEQTEGSTRDTGRAQQRVQFRPSGFV